MSAYLREKENFKEPLSQIYHRKQALKNAKATSIEEEVKLTKQLKELVE